MRTDFDAWVLSVFAGTKEFQIALFPLQDI